MHPKNRRAVRRLREINRTLLSLSLGDATVPEADDDLDAIRQKVIGVIRRLDPKSAKNPPPEECDVAVFTTQAIGAGVLLIEKLKGRRGGSMS